MLLLLLIPLGALWQQVPPTIHLSKVELKLSTVWTHHQQSPFMTVVQQKNRQIIKCLFFFIYRSLTNLTKLCESMNMPWRCFPRLHLPLWATKPNLHNASDWRAHVGPMLTTCSPSGVGRPPRGWGNVIATRISRDPGWIWLVDQSVECSTTWMGIAAMTHQRGSYWKLPWQPGLPHRGIATEATNTVWGHDISDMSDSQGTRKHTENKMEAPNSWNFVWLFDQV